MTGRRAHLSVTGALALAVAFGAAVAGRDGAMFDTLGSGPPGHSASQRHQREATLQEERPSSGDRQHGLAPEFLVTDGGTPEALGLHGEPAVPTADDLPAAQRLILAEEAVQRFATGVSLLEDQRARRLTTDATDTTALDARIAALRHRLAIAELAQRAIEAELTAESRR